VQTLNCIGGVLVGASCSEYGGALSSAAISTTLWYTLGTRTRHVAESAVGTLQCGALWEPEHGMLLNLQ
jgi:hypothetical protein